MADNENLGAPQSRNEALLQNVLGANYDLGEPQSRNEALLMKIAGEDVDVDFEPQSRIEVLLKEIIDNGGTGGGVEVESLSVTENGTYTAEEGTAYSPVSVNVPQTQVESLSVTENGTYTAPSGVGYSPVTVDVQGGATLQAVLDGTISGSVEIVGIEEGATGGQKYNGLFQNCNNLTSVTWTKYQCAPNSCFRNCNNLVYVSMPDAIAMAHDVCNDSTSLEAANFPKLSLDYWGYSQQGNNFFRNCQKLTSVFAPKIANIKASFFENCYLLPAFEADVAGKIEASAFGNCRALETLILRNTSLVTLSNVNAFNNTPFRGYGGYSGHIYVPQSLIASYQTASNWSTLYASYNDLFQPIEGSPYENARLDGTPLT